MNSNESYSNTMFTGVLQLPKSLTKIGKRAFVGSENIHYVMLPKALTTVEADAFCLGTFNEKTMEFENIHARSTAAEKIVFYYEGTELEKISEENLGVFRCVLADSDMCSEY